MSKMVELSEINYVNPINHKELLNIIANTLRYTQLPTHIN